ncbi:unnamed protein product [Alopecurus aequalis]
MGRRPDRSVGALACCRVAVVVVLVLCTSLLLVMVMVATASGVGVFAAAQTGGRVTTTSSPARYSGGGQAVVDAYRSSKRRIPKGPDPIHNRRAGKTTIAPRRRD